MTEVLCKDCKQLKKLCAKGLCKSCYAKSLYYKHKKERLKKSKKWYLKNREKVLEKNKQYSKSERGKKTKKKSWTKWYQKNKDWYSQYMKEYSKKPDVVYKDYKRRSKFKDVEFKLSVEEFTTLVLQNCYYCNELPNPIHGVDRLNNSKGYTTKNCVSCCSICNYLKGGVQGLDRFEFLERIKKIYLYQIEIGNIK